MLKYFGLESQISLIDTLEIIYKYSIEVQKDRVQVLTVGEKKVDQQKKKVCMHVVERFQLLLQGFLEVCT